MNLLKALVHFLAGPSEIAADKPTSQPHQKGPSGSAGHIPSPASEKRGGNEPLAKQFDEIELRRRHAEVAALEYNVKLWMAIKERLSELFFERGPLVVTLLVIGVALNFAYYEGSTLKHLADRLNTFVAPEKADVRAERVRFEAEAAAAKRERDEAVAARQAMQVERDNALQQAAQQRGVTEGVRQSLSTCQTTLAAARHGYIRQVDCDVQVTNYFSQYCAVRR
jgi:hypothetical protein